MIIIITESAASIFSLAAASLGDCAALLGSDGLLVGTGAKS